MATIEGEELIDATYSAEQVERLLCCPICLDRFNNPRILPCQHTFCKTPCLEGLVDMRNRQVRCPECRKEHYVPPSGAGGFPPNITIANFLDLPTQRGQGQGHSGDTSNREEAFTAGTPNKCGVCENEATTVKCFHCNKLVCESCKRSHTGQMKLDISRLLNQIRRGVPKISNAISSVEQKSEQFKQQVELVKAEVTEQIDKYVCELRERQRQLHSELDTLQQGELRSLRLYQENLEVEMASISSYCDSTERLVNQADLVMPEADMVNIKRQCVEYMEQLRHTENSSLPDTRHVHFRHNGASLHQSIACFGEAMIENPLERRHSTLTTSTSQNNSNNRPSQRQRWENMPPLDRSYFDTMRVSPSPSPSTQRSLSPPAHWQSAQEPQIEPRGTYSSTDYRSLSNNTVDHYTSRGHRGQNLPPARIADYMYTMNNIPDELLFDVNFPGNYRTNNTTRGRGRGNPSSLYARERNGERMAALIGGGIAARSFPSPEPDVNSNNNTNNRSTRRQVRPTEPLPIIPRPQRDPRPTEYYEVDLDGNLNLVTLPGSIPQRGGRPDQSIDNQANLPGHPTEAQASASQNAASNGLTSENEQATSNGSSEQTLQDNGTQSTDVSERSSENTANTTSAVNENPQQVQRARTFVQEEGTEMDAEVLPRVSDNSVHINIPLNRTMDAEEMSALLQQAANNLPTDRPLINYQTKGQVLMKIGGERGSGEGKFKLPRGLAVSPNNDSIVVADSSNHRVQIFDCNGHFVKAFGSYGDRDGEFDCLAGVAINSDGDIIITDRYNQRIQVFDRYGTFKKKFGREGQNNGQLNYPWGCACDTSGFIYVCDKENHRVQVFRPNGNFVRKFGGLGNTPGKLENPYFLTLTSDRKVIVSDTNNHRIQIFNSEGRFVKTFGSQGTENGKFKNPKGIAVDLEGNIIVADSGNHRIQIFRPDGSFFCKFGTKGRNDGQFKDPEGVALTSDGKIVVSDKENYRIQLF